MDNLTEWMALTVLMLAGIVSGKGVAATVQNPEPLNPPNQKVASIQDHETKVMNDIIKKLDLAIEMAKTQHKFQHDAIK